MEITNQQICEEFSKGNFKTVYNYLAEDIEWNIVGDKIIKNKNSLIEFCDKTAEYFASVTTVFNMIYLIAENNCVAINGTAAFINKEKKSTNVSSCDVYHFKDGKIQNITSYCIITSGK